MSTTFRLTRNYPDLGLVRGDLCRFGQRGELLEVYRAVNVPRNTLTTILRAEERRARRQERTPRKAGAR